MIEFEFADAYGGLETKNIVLMNIFWGRYHLIVYIDYQNYQQIKIRVFICRAPTTKEGCKEK